MQAYAEGFELLESSRFGQDLDLKAVCDLWNNGSVVRSWLLKLVGQALAEDPKLEELAGYVEDSGEGRWTVTEAMAEQAGTSMLPPFWMVWMTSRAISRQSW